MGDKAATAKVQLLNPIIQAGCGKQTPEGGEIYVDYANNKAMAPKASAHGTNNQAGVKGYHIYRIEYGVYNSEYGYWGWSDYNTGEATHACLHLSNMDTTNPNSPYADGDIIQISIAEHFANCYKVVTGLSQSGYESIVVTRIEDGALIPENFVMADYNEDTYYAYNYCWVAHKDEGNMAVPCITAPAAFGEDNKAAASGAFASGKGNRVTGDYSSVAGRNNNNHGEMSYIAGGYGNYIAPYTKYGFIGGGSGNQIEGNYGSIIGGNNNVIPKGADRVRLHGINLTAANSDQHIDGRNNNPDKLFEYLYGNGKSASVKKNGFGMDWQGNFYIENNAYVCEWTNGITKDPNKIKKLATEKYVADTYLSKTDAADTYVSIAQAPNLSVANAKTADKLTKSMHMHWVRLHGKYTDHDATEFDIVIMFNFMSSSTRSWISGSLGNLNFSLPDGYTPAAGYCVDTATGKVCGQVIEVHHGSNSQFVCFSYITNNGTVVNAYTNADGYTFDIEDAHFNYMTVA